MGVFGAPPIEDTAEQTANHAVRAVRAARNMIREWTSQTCHRWGKPILLRAGINTGKVVIGNVGFPGRFEYTALGDAVNLAARMQKLAQPGSIAFTDSTCRLIGKEFQCKPTGAQEVKGLGRVSVWYIS